MTESILASAVEMATRSVNRVGDFLNTVSTANENKSASNNPDENCGFRSRFSWLRQSLNEKRCRLSEGFSNVFSASNSPSNVVGRLLSSPAPLRRAKSERRQMQSQQKMRDFYLGQRRGDLSSQAKPWDSFDDRESSSSKQEIGIDLLQRYTAGPSTTEELHVLNRATGRYWEAEQTRDADRTAKTAYTFGEDSDKLSFKSSQDVNGEDSDKLSFKSSQDVTRAVSDSDSEAYIGSESSKNRKKERFDRSCLVYRQESVRGTSQYDRQDSGFHSEGECFRYSHHVNDKNSDAVPNTEAYIDNDDGQTDGTCNKDPFKMISQIMADIDNDDGQTDGTCNKDPFKMISQIMASEQNEKRDSYRIIRRPSQKQVKQKHSVKKNLSVGDILLLNRVEQDRKMQEIDGNDEPKLKLSVQTFASSRQLRLIVMEMANLDKLDIQEIIKDKHLQVCLKIGKTKQKIQRELKSMEAGIMWEVFHFFDVDIDDMSDAELRIRVRSKHRYAFYYIVCTCLVLAEN